MKKIVFLLLIALCLPIGLMAQSYDDDLYFIPSKEKEEPAPEKKEPVRRQATTNIYTSPGTTVVVQDRPCQIQRYYHFPCGGRSAGTAPLTRRFWYSCHRYSHHRLLQYLY